MDGNDELITQIKEFIQRHEALIKKIDGLMHRVEWLQEQLNDERDRILSLETMER